MTYVVPALPVRTYDARRRDRRWWRPQTRASRRPILSSSAAGEFPATTCQLKCKMPRHSDMGSYRGRAAYNVHLVKGIVLRALKPSGHCPAALKIFLPLKNNLREVALGLKQRGLHYVFLGERPLARGRRLGTWALAGHRVGSAVLGWTRAKVGSHATDVNVGVACRDYWQKRGIPVDGQLEKCWVTLRAMCSGTHGSTPTPPGRVCGCRVFDMEITAMEVGLLAEGILIVE